MQISFESLVSNLSLLGEVFDKSVGAKDKIVFLYNGYLIAKSGTVMCKVALEYEGDFENCAVTYDYLSSLVSGYSNLAYTEVSWVDWNIDGDKIHVAISEEAKEEGYESFERTSHFELEKRVTPEALIKQLDIEYPSDSDTVTYEEMEQYFGTLYPLLTGANSGSQTKISFADDYVFYFSSVFQSFVKNNLPNVMHGVELKNTTVSLLKTLFLREESLEISRVNNSLLISTLDRTLECVMKIDKVTFIYNKFTEGYLKETQVAVDRVYLNEVLSRIASFGGEAVISFKDGYMVVDNDKYSQEIPLMQVKGELENIQFKISTSIVEKMFLGNTNNMPKASVISLIDQGSAVAMYVGDSSDEWFSCSRLTKKR